MHRLKVWNRWRDFEHDGRASTNSHVRALKPTDETVCCFTDGSRQNGLSGCGFLAYKDGSEWFSGSISLGEWATIFQAEVHAISS